jgi:hypothetical protein
VLHGLVAAVGSRLHSGDRAGEEEAAVGTGDAGQLDAAVGREDGAAVVAADVGNGPVLAGRLNATAIFRSVVMVGTMPPRSILWMAAADTSD